MTHRYSDAGELWAGEGGARVSDLIDILAEVAGIHDFSGAGPDVLEAGELALGMKAPVFDWEGPARAEGWLPDETGLTTGACYKRDHGETHDAANWREACVHEQVKPVLRTVTGHWLVSHWLADRLIEKGERVTKNFHGLTLWARTGTEPELAHDPVLGIIARATATLTPTFEDGPSP